MRPRVLLASIAVHGALAALLVALALRTSTLPLPASVAIEVISPINVEPKRERTLTPIVATPGNASLSKKGSDPTSKPRDDEEASHPISSSRGGETGADLISKPRDGKRRPDLISDPRGEIRFEEGDGYGEDDSYGMGNGRGSGAGGGGGMDDGGGLGRADSSGAAAIAQLAPPPAPSAEKISKARPAILVYPKKHGSDDDSAVFVAQVTIDDEGYVVGAHVTSGEGGTRGEQAAALIWRFRYDPARDEDGRPIRSTLEQPFLVGR